MGICLRIRVESEAASDVEGSTSLLCVVSVWFSSPGYPRNQNTFGADCVLVRHSMGEAGRHFGPTDDGKNSFLKVKAAGVSPPRFWRVYTVFFIFSSLSLTTNAFSDQYT